ncbi:MAG: thiamine pyrophosphate-binding protein [Candidatus Marinimicrobia bacterium]|jgi:acetolactate synthase I/II/III large subunit|nr:thiamine pyrophosphate-binding protein [Candidatus Neomarinimicrobiota bacterium]
MRVADYLIRRLVTAGAQHVFMLPGGAAMYLNDAVGRTPELTPVCNLHEQACAIAAEAYARVSGSFGVVLVTAGPGGTNAITGLAGAWLDSTPVIVLSGQVKTTDLKGDRGVRQYGIQEIDIVRLVKPLTKYAVTVTDPQTIRYHLEQALWHANSGRKGPVWLDLPLDIQGATINPDSLQGFTPPDGADLVTLPANVIERTIALFNQAKRPVLLAGAGVRMAGAVKQLRALAERWQIPVLTSWLGMDLLDADHPLYFGRPGGMAPRGANFTIQNADFLLVLGSRLDLGLVGYSYENFARAAQKVIVDIDPEELAKYPIAIDLSVVADARVFLDGLLAHNEQLSDADRTPWLTRCRNWQERYPLLTDDQADPSQPLSAYLFSATLIEELEAEDIIVPGSSGFACEIFLLMYRCKEGQRMFHNRGTGSMGFGLPASIGACLASGGRRTICVDGDGGIQMNIQELETVCRLNLPIKLFVINNDGFASIRSSQSGYFNQLVGADSTSGLTLPNIRRVADAYGLPTLKINGTSKLSEQLRYLLAQPGPLVCEVVVRPDESRIPRLASVRKTDGSMASRPLEDLFPFLDRDELQENMLIPLLPE